MAFDANLNIGKASDRSMNHDTPSQDFSDWFQNEESLDLATFMSDSRNLELCSDDLFQNLFPSNSADPKKNHLNYIDQEVEDLWSHSLVSDPISACSSTVTSPATVNFYNTPPVTPQPERQRVSSPHNLQFDGLTTTMSSSRFASLRPEDVHGNIMSVHNTQNNLSAPSEMHMLTVKQEHNPEMHMLPVPVSIKSEAHEDLTSIPSTSFGGESLKRPATSSPSISQKKTKVPPKGTVEYIEKRKRNNVAVRRSRDKAKIKAIETQQRVEELSLENETLHKRVAELTHELVTLKKLLQALPQM